MVPNVEVPLKVGLVGCGNISDIYLENARKLDAIEVVACADLVEERAEAKAAEYGVPRACTLDELLVDPEIAIVLNLTTPGAHAEIALAALEAGKSIYNEKPLAIRLDDGHRILETARSENLRVGCAPDTFLGGAWQTARKLIDDGAIGKPVAATACMTCHGHENWHPDPEFLYQVGGGPMFDMGPYYLTALVNLLGPVKRATGAANITFPPLCNRPEHVIEFVKNIDIRVRVVIHQRLKHGVAVIISLDGQECIIPEFR